MFAEYPLSDEEISHLFKCDKAKVDDLFATGRLRRSVNHPFRSDTVFSRPNIYDAAEFLLELNPAWTSNVDEVLDTLEAELERSCPETSTGMLELASRVVFGCYGSSSIS